MQIMEAVARIVSTLPEEQRRSALGAMLMPVVQPLQQALANSHSNGGSAPHAAAQPSDAVVLPLFDRLTIVFRCVYWLGDDIKRTCQHILPTGYRGYM